MVVILLPVDWYQRRKEVEVVELLNLHCHHLLLYKNGKRMVWYRIVEKGVEDCRKDGKRGGKFGIQLLISCRVG